MSHQNSTNQIRTRFAPSPTGYLHLGGARTALFSWAFAKHHNGVFVLRIEDTDLERSTPEAVQAILDGMQWLGLSPDEGPFYQMQNNERHKELVQKLLEDGHAYYCYSSPEEIEAMRESARAMGLKPRYDGTWRPEPGKTLPEIPANRKPVVRFRTPTDGVTSWNDMVKGNISIANSELDDLIIARPDGTPTYNFCVVADDWDMKITHVIRGDDHVNNTPRQINIFKALGAPVPVFGHVPMILGPDGEKLSKRHGAVSVMDYDTQGYLPKAMINYLARLGFSHGDNEIFSQKQLIEWFDGSNLSKSAAKWDPKKLNWVNAHYIKETDASELVDTIKPRVEKLGGDTTRYNLAAIIDLFKSRAESLNDLAQGAMLFYGEYKAADSQDINDITDINILQDFYDAAGEIKEWNKANISAAIKETLAKHGAKMPALGIPLRLIVTGQRQTPSVDTVLEIIGQKTVLDRISNYI